MPGNTKYLESKLYEHRKQDEGTQDGAMLSQSHWVTGKPFMWLSAVAEAMADGTPCKAICYLQQNTFHSWIFLACTDNHMLWQGHVLWWHCWKCGGCRGEDEVGLWLQKIKKYIFMWAAMKKYLVSSNWGCSVQSSALGYSGHCSMKPTDTQFWNKNPAIIPVALKGLGKQSTKWQQRFVPFYSCSLVAVQLSNTIS